MNSSERAQRKDSWLRVYHHEITRRKRIWQEKPKAYRQIFGPNRKGLDEQTECQAMEAYGKHVWVPATHLWIHDAKKGFKLDGINRRGFSEAETYEYDGFRVVPQICWSCIATRELMSPVIPWSARQTLAQHILNDKRKPKGKRGQECMLEDYDELFDNIEYA